VGFDDTLDAQEADPPLTTVHQPLFAMGQRATEMLLNRLQGRMSPVWREALECRLVVRATSGPPPGWAGEEEGRSAAAWS
jgi:DNA-binding LacI/PurR family transcriptional regulator